MATSATGGGGGSRAPNGRSRPLRGRLLPAGGSGGASGPGSGSDGELRAGWGRGGGPASASASASPPPRPGRAGTAAAAAAARSGHWRPRGSAEPVGGKGRRALAAGFGGDHRPSWNLGAPVGVWLVLGGPVSAEHWPRAQPQHRGLHAVPGVAVRWAVNWFLLCPLPCPPSPVPAAPTHRRPALGYAFCSEAPRGTEEGSPPKTGGDVFAALLGSGACLLSILEDLKEAATQ